VSAARRAYDHRLRELTCEERDPRLFAHLGIPRSTTVSWIRRGARDVVSADVVRRDSLELQAEILRLRKRVAQVLAISRLAFLLLRLSGFRLDGDRLPQGAKKASILDAISRATKAIPLAVALRVLRLSAARYYAWRNLAPDCLLDDRASCPKAAPQQLTPEEIRGIRDMVTDPAYRHVPISGLAVLAQRLKKVFAAPATWHRLVRERGWRRPRRRLYPPKPTLGLRATKPNEFWHIDVTVFRLLDGRRVYLHAVIDNFSRRILSWKAALCLDPSTTCAVLLQASNALGLTDRATVVADSGVENVNSQVDALLGLGQLRLILAQVEIAFSNSMIEAWWRALKHQWLYLNQLDTLAGRGEGQEKR
jgi:putative transposase